MSWSAGVGRAESPIRRGRAGGGHKWSFASHNLHDDLDDKHAVGYADGPKVAVQRSTSHEHGDARLSEHRR